jgi:hypothetical protein
MNKLINKYLILGVVALSAFACDEKDDLTGDSTLTPSTPTVNVNVASSSVAFIEKDSTFEYTVTLSEPQIVDVDVYVTQVGGNATEGEDFTIGTSVVTIPANSTRGTAVISIKADELAEDIETLTIQIGDDRTANASITPTTITYTISNVTGNDLPLHLSWDVNFKDASGTAVTPTTVADLILYLTDANGVIIDEADGAAFEDYVLMADAPDGEYLIKAGVFDVIDPGDLGDAPILDLSLEFAQVGKIDETALTFAGALDTKLVCGGNLFTLAKITKNGTNYTVTEVGEASSVDVTSFVGDYLADEPGYAVYPVSFTAGSSPGELVVDNFWDSGAEISYILDVCGDVTIPSQSFVAGASYTVTGSGTYDDATKQMVVDYVVKNAAGAAVDTNTHTFVKQ